MSSHTIAATLPVRSPSVSLRYSPPSRRVRTSASRTSKAWVTSHPSTNWRTSIADAKIEWRADVNGSAIVTGGTGGLGAAVVSRLLDEGWRVVVPWIAEHELKRLSPAEGLELVKADLF